MNWGEHHVPDDQMLHDVISDSRDNVQGVDDKVTDVQEAGMGQRLVRHNSLRTRKTRSKMNEFLDLNLSVIRINFGANFVLDQIE